MMIITHPPQENCHLPPKELVSLVEERRAGKHTKRVTVVSLAIALEEERRRAGKHNKRLIVAPLDERRKAGKRTKRVVVPRD
jgi:hypothetical protein